MPESRFAAGYLPPTEELRVAVQLPAHSSDFQEDFQDQKRQSHDHPGGYVLAKAALADGCSVDVHSAFDTTSRPSGSDLAASQPDTPHRPEVTECDGASVAWLNATDRYCSLPVQEILIQSRKNLPEKLFKMEGVLNMGSLERPGPSTGLCIEDA